MFFAASLLACLVILLALLAVPFDISFSVQRREAFQSEVAVVWLFGLVRFRIPGKSGGKPIKTPGKSKPAKKRKSTNIGTIKNLLWNARFRQRLIRFVKDLFKSIRIASFYLRLRLGLDDPADTGRLWAMLGPMSVFLSSISNTAVSLEPDFQTETLYVDGRGKVRIVPLQIVITALAFVASPITIGAIIKANRSKRI